MASRALISSCAPWVGVLSLAGILVSDGLSARPQMDVGTMVRSPVRTLSSASASSSIQASATYLFANPEVGGTEVEDFNGDGRLDLVQPGAILLGFGDGTFAPGKEKELEPGAHFSSVATGDFNGDGIFDLALTESSSATVAVLIGAGDGTFRRAETLSVGTQPVSVLVADFDGDGFLDLVVPSAGSDDLSHFSGHGDGTFSPAQRTPLPAAVSIYGGGIAAADLNADGRQDLVMVGQGHPGQVFVFLGNRDGSISEQPPFESGDNPTHIAIGDWDRDSHLDLAITNPTGDRGVSLFFGRGDGTFTRTSHLAFDGYPYDIADGDLDGDGLLDLVVVNPCADGSNCRLSRLSIFSGRVNGTFELSDSGIWSAPYQGAPALADLNQDGLTDILASGTVLLRRPDGHYDYPIVAPLDNAGGPRAADFNGDGRGDLVFIDFAAGDIVTLLGRTDGQFDVARTPAGAHDGGLFALGDLNSDRLPDLAVVPADRSSIHFFLSRGNGEFLSAGHLEVGAYFSDPAFGDFDEDGNADLGLVAYPLGTMIFRGNGDGTFEEPIHVSIGAPGGTNYPPDMIVTGDFNGDGHRDLLIHERPSRQYRSLLLGRGDGTFATGFAHEAEPFSEEGLWPATWAVGDFNGDGIDDLASFDGPFGRLSMDLGGPVAPLEAGPNLQGFPTISPSAALVADLNHDGNMDLAVAVKTGGDAGRSQYVEIFPGRGDGTLGGGARFSAGLLAGPLISGDFNGDGRIDLLVATKDSHFRLMLNQGPYPDTPPVAKAQSVPEVECTSPAGAIVTLDGTASSDLDSDPGTNNDLVSYEWIENLGSPASIFLGSGSKLQTQLPLGIHVITLRVKDRRGVPAMAQTVVTVADTARPTLALSAEPAVLWPPNNKLVPVHIAWQAADVCDPSPKVTLQSVSYLGSDRGVAGDIQAQPGTADEDVLLRASRSGSGSDRTYLLTYLASDGSGNTSAASVSVVVPHDQVRDGR